MIDGDSVFKEDEEDDTALLLGSTIVGEKLDGVVVVVGVGWDSPVSNSIILLMKKLFGNAETPPGGIFATARHSGHVIVDGSDLVQKGMEKGGEEEEEDVDDEDNDSAGDPEIVTRAAFKR